MGFGVLEPKSTEVVQGSIHLFDDQNASSTENTTHLKHSKDGKIVLAPQPSDSPDDILNLPLWRRDLMYWIIILGTVFSGIHGPILSPITLDLAAQWDKSVNDIAQLSSYLVLGIGACALLYGPLAIEIWQTHLVHLGYSHPDSCRHLGEPGDHVQLHDGCSLLVWCWSRRVRGTVSCDDP